MRTLIKSKKGNVTWTFGV